MMPNSLTGSVGGPDMANLIIARLIIHQVFERDEDRRVVQPRYNGHLSNIIGKRRECS